MKKPWTTLFIILILLFLIGIGLFSGRFMIYLTIRVMLLGIFALGYNLLLGRTGLLSFGHGAFYAAGAYGLGFFSLHLTSHPLLGILVGVLVAALLALIIGFFCVRHTEIYFAMLTLAFGMMVFSLIWNLRDFTGGDDGLVGIMRDSVSFFGLFKISIKNDKQYYYLVLAFFVLSAWTVHRIQNSPFGLALAGIRENANRSEFAGVSVKNYRLTVFVISGAFAGLAGALETLLESNARPFMAHWSHSAEPILVSLLGGLLSFTGPLVGSIFFVAMREIIQRFTENWMLWFGVVLLIVIMGFRGGVVGVIEGLTGGTRKKLKE
ncbi:MAG: branched-chain amino acid ABC transporter permease [Desulfobacca sp.]|nr:branched-chain amino acid ABC transporter permease [Desulfobacca sp.]